MLEFPRWKYMLVALVLLLALLFALPNFFGDGPGAAGGAQEPRCRWTTPRAQAVEQLLSERTVPFQRHLRRQRAS